MSDKMVYCHTKLMNLTHENTSYGKNICNLLNNAVKAVITAVNQNLEPNIALCFLDVLKELHLKELI